jgi:hypothetical protein
VPAAEQRALCLVLDLDLPVAEWRQPERAPPFPCPARELLNGMERQPPLLHRDLHVLQYLFLVHDLFQTCLKSRLLPDFAM